METSQDQRIGENIASYRRGRSQEWLAEQMRERGHGKWSQSTVWSVEKGKRPLKFGEALDITEVLGLSDPSALADSQVGGQLMNLTQQAKQYANQISSTKANLYKVQQVLREVLSALGDNKADVNPRTLAHAESWAQRSLEEILDVRTRDPATPEQLEKMRTLALPLQREGRGGLYQCPLGHASVVTFIEGVTPSPANDCTSGCGNIAVLVSVPDDQVDVDG